MSERASTFQDEDAIIAIGSPPGPGRRGMLRISGHEMIEVLADAFLPPLPRTGPRVIPTTIQSDDSPSGDGIPCLVLVSASPKSFTGQDVIEILLPGNPHLLDRTDAAMRRVVAKKGRILRAAGPGEFTARAFLAGRLDAAAVTGIALAIAADDRQGLEAANRWRDGGDAVVVGTAAAELTKALARLEASIDFTDEEDVVGCSAGELRLRLGSTRAPLQSVLDATRAVTSATSDRYRVVLAGPPNAGKSSLFNRLVGTHRTVAHDRAGTTRDAIEAHVDLEDGFGLVAVTFIDTAGLGPTSDPLADAATEISHQARRSADLELWCIGADTEKDEHPPASAESQDRIVVVTKSDLIPEHVLADGMERCSARTGAGIDALRQAIAGRAERTSRLGAASAHLLGSIRHDLESGLASIDEAIEMLNDVPDGVSPPHPEIVVAVARDALQVVGRRFGGHDPEAVLDQVFGSFCIGK